MLRNDFVFHMQQQNEYKLQTRQNLSDRKKTINMMLNIKTLTLFLKTQMWFIFSYISAQNSNEDWLFLTDWLTDMAMFVLVGYISRWKKEHETIELRFDKWIGIILENQNHYTKWIIILSYNNI